MDNSFIIAAAGVLGSVLSYIGGRRTGTAAITEARAAIMHSETDRMEKITALLEKQIDVLQERMKGYEDRIAQLEKEKYEIQKDWKTVAVELIEVSRYKNELLERLRKYE